MNLLREAKAIVFALATALNKCLWRHFGNYVGWASNVAQVTLSSATSGEGDITYFDEHGI